MCDEKTEHDNMLYLLKRGMTRRGLIALQVHSIGKKRAPGEEIRWRDLRLKEL